MKQFTKWLACSLKMNDSEFVSYIIQYYSSLFSKGLPIIQIIKNKL